MANHTLSMRPEGHEIDTLARRQVPRALPLSWEHRELTGRDYGIDMMVELFTESNPTGQYLLLQIKGTKSNIDTKIKNISFDVPVNTMRYSELFVAPVIVAICPVNVEPSAFYYIWLQEYIRVVLNYENPSWRNNKTKVRVTIPVTNKMPGTENKLQFIANFPRRLFGLSSLGRLLDEISHELNGFWVPENYNKALQYLYRIRELPGVFDGTWPWATFHQEKYLNPSIQAIEDYLQGKFPAGRSHPTAGFFERLAEESPEFGIRSQITYILDILPIIFDETNYSLKHTLWKLEGAIHY